MSSFQSLATRRAMTNTIHSIINKIPYILDCSTKHSLHHLLWLYHSPPLNPPISFSPLEWDWQSPSSPNRYSATLGKTKTETKNPAPSAIFLSTLTAICPPPPIHSFWTRISLPVFLTLPLLISPPKWGNLYSQIYDCLVPTDLSSFLSGWKLASPPL